MIRRFARFLKEHSAAVGLWLGIGLLLVSSYQRGVNSGPVRRQSDQYSIEHLVCLLAEDIEFAFCPLDFFDSLINTGQASGVRFEPNVGQADSNYGFVAHGRAQSILLSSTEAVFQLKASKIMHSRVIHAALEGAGSGVAPQAGEALSGRVNYLIGNDPKNWHTDIPTFGSVRFPGVYPGIDVAYHGNRGDLETDFVVQPGGDPQAIRIRFGGADEIRLENDGSLSARAETRTLNWKKPVLYQVGAHGVKTAVEGRFKLATNGAVGFEVGVYDIKRPLVIDPVLTYATYFGSADTEAAARVVADANGNAYIIGGTNDENFPSTVGAFATAASGLQGNVLVAKLSANGKSMIYETHIGGSGGDIGWGLNLDVSGNLYLTGMTASSDYPIVPATNNLTTKSITDPLNCFVTKLNAAGNALIYSTLIGGGNADGCSSVGSDSTGNAYVVGVTNSTDLPTVNPIQSSLPGALFGTASTAAFAAKLSPDGSKLLYSTYYGGTGQNAPTSIAVDSAGNAYFTGFTTSSSFSVSGGAYQTAFGGSGGQTNSLLTTGDAFVVKLNPSGQRIYATFLGGSKDDIGVGIAIDGQGDAYIAGATLSGNFPTQKAFQGTYHGAGGDTRSSGGDGFIAELDPTGSTLLFSSYIGGSSDDRVLGIALDSSGNIYLAGHTLSKDFPTAGQQAQAGYAGDTDGLFHTGDAFVAEISTAHALTFSTYLGGSGGDWAGGVAVDGQGGIVIAGGTSSADFPVSTGTYQAQYGGTDTLFVGVPMGDAFIARFGGATSSVSISAISNAASYVGGAIAPGEAVLIQGASIGPAALTTAQLTSSGTISTLVSGTQFTFNGVAAPIVYVSAQYSTVIVPYEVSKSSTAQVIATYNGTPSAPFTIPVVATLPGIFSSNASGTGQGAIYNQDYSINSAKNAAPRGNVVFLFVTGEGQTVPAGVDGAITETQITPAQQVTVSFGGVQATSYQFVGEAPGSVSGVLQINVTIPPLAPTGSAVPVTVTVGSATSQAGLTVAIQ